MPGGIAVFVHNLCLALYERKNQVEVLVSVSEASELKNYDAFDTIQPYRVHRFKKSCVLSSFIPIVKTLIHIARFKPDILILGHVISMHGFGALIAKKVLGIPYIVLSHGGDLGHLAVEGIDRWATHKILMNASLILANSAYTKQLIKKRGYNNERIFVLNPGVNTRLFNPEVNCDALREKYDLKNKKVLLTTARLVAKKNIERVLKALNQVTAQIPNIHYLVIGDGEERARLEELKDGLGLRSHVCFLGDIKNSQLPAFYVAADLFILPSCEISGDIETFGISFIEAGACSKPVIGGRSGGISDAVIDGKTGLLVDPHNISEISETITRLLTNKELALKLGLNGRRRVEEEFDWSKVGERLENYLKQVLKATK